MLQRCQQACPRAVMPAFARVCARLVTMRGAVRNHRGKACSRCVQILIFSVRRQHRWQLRDTPAAGTQPVLLHAPAAYTNTHTAITSQMQSLRSPARSILPPSTTRQPNRRSPCPTTSPRTHTLHTTHFGRHAAPPRTTTTQGRRRVNCRRVNCRRSRGRGRPAAAGPWCTSWGCDSG
jgi:hypothetical protein